MATRSSGPFTSDQANPARRTHGRSKVHVKASRHDALSQAGPSTLSRMAFPQRDRQGLKSPFLGQERGPMTPKADQGAAILSCPRYSMMPLSSLLAPNVANAVWLVRSARASESR